MGVAAVQKDMRPRGCRAPRGHEKRRPDLLPAREASDNSLRQWVLRSRGLIQGKDAMNADWFSDMLNAVFGIFPSVIFGILALIGMVLGL